MKRVDIKLGFSCNNRCKFCAQGGKSGLFPERSTEDIKTILSDCRKKSIDGIVFTGGEATIRKDIISLVRYAKTLGFKTIQIQSNGRFFSYLEFCKKIVDAGANEFSPALHGHNAKTHDFLTSSYGSFDQTIQGIINLKKLGQYVMTNTVITTVNFMQLPKIAKLFKELEVNQWQFAFIHIIGTAAKNAEWIVPRKSKIIPYVKKGLEIGLEANQKVMTEAIPYCFMEGYENCVAEKNIPDTKVIDMGFSINNYTKFRKTQAKTKGQLCRNCHYNKMCEGPWKEYVELFGWNEFKPVKNG